MKRQRSASPGCSSSQSTPKSRAAASAQSAEFFFKAAKAGEEMSDSDSDIVFDWQDASPHVSPPSSSLAEPPSTQSPEASLAPRSAETQRQFEERIYGSWRKLSCVNPSHEFSSTSGCGLETHVAQAFSGADLLKAASDRSQDVYGVHLRFMLQWCVSNHCVKDAFEPDEVAFMHSLLSLPTASLALLQRLHSRKASWFALADIARRYFSNDAKEHRASQPQDACPAHRAAAALASLVREGVLVSLPSSEAPPPAAGDGSSVPARPDVLSIVFEGLPQWLVHTLQFLSTGASRAILNGVMGKLGVKGGASSKRRLSAQSGAATTAQGKALQDAPTGDASRVFNLVQRLTSSSSVVAVADMGETGLPEADDTACDSETEQHEFLTVDALAAATGAAASAGDSKADVVRQLVTFVMAQRTVFGGFLPVASATHKTLLCSLQSTFTAVGSDFDGPLAVRLPAFLQLLLLKVHRLFYLTTFRESSAESALAWSSSWQHDSGAAAGWAQCSNALTSVFVSALNSLQECNAAAPAPAIGHTLSQALGSLASAKNSIPPHLALLSGKLLRRFVGRVLSSAVSPAATAASWRSVPPARVLALLQALGSSAHVQHSAVDTAGGFSPGLLHIFHKLDFVPYTCLVQCTLFASPLHFRVLAACEELSNDTILSSMISKPLCVQPVARRPQPSPVQSGAGYLETADGTLVLSDSEDEENAQGEVRQNTTDDISPDILEESAQQDVGTAVLVARALHRTVFGAHFAAAIWRRPGSQESVGDADHTMRPFDATVQDALHGLFSCPTPHHSPGLRLLTLVASVRRPADTTPCATAAGDQLSADAIPDLPDLNDELAVEMQLLVETALRFPSLLFVLRLSTCLHLYSYWRVVTAQPGDWVKHLICKGHTSEHEFNAHSHLFLLESQQRMAFAMWEAMDSLNRSSLHQWTIPFLRQLLAVPFMRHRNGRVWARLTINLAHVGLRADAALAAWEGLQDQTVVGGDRVYLQRKWSKQRSQVHPLDIPTLGSPSAANPDSSSGCGESPSTVAVGCNDDAAMLPAWIVECLKADRVAEEGPVSNGNASSATTGTDISVLLVNDLSRISPADCPPSILQVEFEHRPLNRTIGEKSRFLGFDADNDHEDDCHDSSSSRDRPSSEGSVDVECCSTAPGANGRNWQHALHARGLPSQMHSCSMSCVADGVFALKGAAAALMNGAVHSQSSGGRATGDEDAAQHVNAAFGISNVVLFSMIVAEAQWEHSVVPATVAAVAAPGDAAVAAPRYAAGDASPSTDTDSALDQLFSTWPVLRHKGGAAALQGVAMHTAASAGRPAAWRRVSQVDSKSPSPNTKKDTTSSGADASADQDGPVEEPFMFIESGFASDFIASAALSTLPALPKAGNPWDNGFTAWSKQTQAARQMGVSVEHLCIGEYHKAGGWTGMHVEGGPLMSLAALLSFEVVFSLQWDSSCNKFVSQANIPDVFLTPYQDCPLDMTAGGVFAERRRAAVQSLLVKLMESTSTDLAIWVAETYCRAYGYQVRNLNWKRYPLSLLQLIAIGMGGRGLAHFCACYLSDPSHFTAGLPDLLLWRITTPTKIARSDLCVADATENSSVPVERLTVPPARTVPSTAAADTGDHQGMQWPTSLPAFCPPCIWELLPQPLSAVLVEVCLSEAKGPRDSLSDKQRTWMSALAAGGVNVHLCKVKEPKLQSNPKKRRSR